MIIKKALLTIISKTKFVQIVVVPDDETSKKVPKVPGLLKYRKDTKELYVRANESWCVVAQEEKVRNEEILILVSIISCETSPGLQRHNMWDLCWIATILRTFETA